MNYLNRIIAINSFLLSKGKIDVYEIHGGTVILGTNTKGKSSFLRTQLLFYGAKPEYISSLSGNRNLTNFYFKTDSSYLVFEYFKDGKPNLVVAFSSDRQSVSYRFITGSFDESLFTHVDAVTGKSKFINNQDLKTHLKTQDRDCSPIFKYQEYASIIQSGKFERGSNNDAKRRNELRHQFSLCPNNVSIVGVDRIALSIIDSTPSIETIKKLLANNVADLAKDIQKNVTDRTSNIDVYHRDMRIVAQAQKFQEQRSAVQEIMSLKQNILANNIRLKGLKYEAESLYEKQHEEEVLVQENIQEVYIERADREAGYEAARSEFNDSIGRLEANIAQLSDDINALESTYQSYQKKNIESFGTLANQIPSIKSEIESLKTRLTALTGEHERIINQYDNELRQFKDEQEKYLVRERELSESRLEELREKASEINDELHKTLQGISDRFKGVRSRLDEEHKELIREVEAKKALVNNPISPEIERTTLMLKEANEDLKCINSRYRDLSNQSSRLQEEHQDLRKERESKLTQRENLEADNEELSRKITELGRELTVVDSMLYFRVLEKDPDKAELMTKTLKQSVLKAKTPSDLNVDENNTSFLGIDFDFGKFESTRPDTKDVIESKLRKATTAKNQNEENANKLGKEVEFLTDKIDQVKKKLNQLSIDLKTCERNERSVDSTIKSFGEKLEILKSELKNTVQQQIDQKNQELLSLFEKQTNLDKEEEAEKDNAWESSTAKKTQVDEAISSAKRALKAETERVKDLIEKKSNEIDRNKEASLNEAGAPTQVIQQTKAKIKGLEGELEEAENAQNKYEIYKLWKKQSYDQLPKHKQNLAVLTERLNKNERKLQELKDSEIPKIKELKDKEAELKKRADDLHDDINTLSNLLKIGDSKFSRMESRKHFDRLPPPALEIQNAVSEYIKENDRFFNEGKQAFGSIVRVFHTYTELVELCSELLASEGFFDVGSANQWLDSIASMNLLLNGSLEQEIQARLDSFKALGDHLINLNAHLDEIDTKLSSAGRRVTKHMNESSGKFNAIGELGAKITSKIPQMTFKKALVRAVSVINNKKGLEPDETFLNAVTDAVSAIQRDATDMDVTKMINVAIHLENKDGKIEQATTDSELLKISSEGMSFLILIMIFVAIKNSIAHNKGVELLWSLDEVGRIHPENVKIISDILKSEEISFLCAGPSIDAQVASLFENIYKIVNDKETGLDFVVKTEAEPTATDIFNAVLEGSERNHG